MKTPSTPLLKTTGFLFILGAVLLFVPYTALTIVFDYPDILRENPGIVLSRFHEGGARLIGIWWAFAVVGLPLLGAYVLLGQSLENRIPYMRLTTTLGVAGLLMQMAGLLRWTFVIPILASRYVNAESEATREALTAIFQVVHQYGGVVLGEHLGQFFTIVWTVGTALALRQTGLIPRWQALLAFLASGIYLLAQGELFATVIPAFPVWDLAGFLGSTLWLIWLIVVGIWLLRKNT